MSLINQVLQDLEKRHASEPELQSLPPHVRAVAGHVPGFTFAKAVAAVLIVAGIVVAAFYFGGWMRTPTPPPSVIAAEPPVPPSALVTELQAQTPEPAFAAEASGSPPAFKLSGELAFVPDSRAGKAPAPKAEKPAPVQAPAPAVVHEQPRAAVELPRASEVAATPAAEPAPAPSAPIPQEPVAAQAALKPSVEESPPAIDKQMREMTPQQRAELAFRRGVGQLRDARAAAAEASFREALREDQNHVASRQALLGLLLDARRNDEAEQLLRTTLTLNPRQPRHAMVLARLQVDRGEVAGGINTLVGALPYVQSDPQYYAFLAALLQREGRHKETVEYYRAALRSSPGNALWLMGIGISLRATSQFAEARESFERAIETRQLTGDLLAFTERQLKELDATNR